MNHNMLMINQLLKYLLNYNQLNKRGNHLWKI